MKLGFIGCGNMASAMIGGILKNNLCAPADIQVSDLSQKALDKAKTDFGVSTTGDNIETAKGADVLVLSVKPQFYPQVIAEIKDTVNTEQLVLTIAPGKTLKWLTEQFGKAVCLARAMPNTPALVGEGITAVTIGDNVPQARQELVMKILGSFGIAQQVPEHLMDAVGAVSGSSPAYVFVMIEAMADAAVAQGMPRAQAYTFAAQAVLGSAKMVLETGKHPGELKDMVCSPGGTTIEAIRVLEEKGFRGALIDAMTACAEKSKNM